MQDAGGLLVAVRLWNLVTYDLTMEGGVNIKNATDIQRNAARLLQALKVPARDYAITLLIPHSRYCEHIILPCLLAHKDLCTDHDHNRSSS